MLSYRHGFHAGNSADIVKHITLIAVIKAFCRKEKPFVYFDTHAGAGYYDLDSDWAKQTSEAEQGIVHLMRLKKQYAKQEQTDSLAPQIPPLISEYIDLCAAWYRNGHFYPGSPTIAHHFMRENDEIVLMELHNNEYEELRMNTHDLARYGPPRFHLHHSNGFQTLSALCPPRSPLPTRGFILIDPSYETDSDFTDVTDTVNAVLKRWQNACILIWYPLVTRRITEITQMKEFCTAAAEKNGKTAVCLEQSFKEPEETGLYGSGMCLINPPWQVDEELQRILPSIQLLLDSQV